MRPWRIGTSSGTRVAACSWRSAIGSGRSAAGSQSPWLERGTAARAALPAAARSATLRCSTRVGLALGSAVAVLIRPCRASHFAAPLATAQPNLSPVAWEGCQGQVAAHGAQLAVQVGELDVGDE